VRAIRKNLVGARLDQARFAQPQGVEAHRVFGAVLAPLRIGNILKRLDCVVIAASESAIEDPLRGCCRIIGAEISRFQNCPQYSLGRCGMLADEVRVAGYRATKILRPRPISRGIDDHMADVTRMQFLRLRRKAEERIDLAPGKKLQRVLCRAHDPMNLLCRVKPDIGRHAADEHVWTRAQLLYANSLSLQIADAANVTMGKQFIASDVQPTEYGNPFAEVDQPHLRADEG